MIGNTNATTIIGGGGTPSGYKVQWIDIDGTILKTEYVASGSAATPPTTTPAYDSTYLTFQGWNLPYSSITSPTNIGAMYHTPDYGSWGYSRVYAFIRVDATSGYDATFYFNLSSGGSNRQVIDWGDGSTTSSNSGGNLSFTHTYAAYGNYVVIVGTNNLETLKLGNGTSSTVFCGGATQTKRNQLYKLYVGKQVTAGYNYELYQCNRLETISLNPNWSNPSPSYWVQECKTLKNLNLPVNMGGLGINAVATTLGLEYINFGTNYAVMNNATALFQTPRITQYIIPANVTSMTGTDIFKDNFACKVFIFKPTTPPTILATTFSDLNKFAKIYVPNASVTTYQAATYWSAVSTQIYPMSQLS